MSDYDFHQLSPLDFELLVRDLLQAELNVTMESFKTGKDGGIDIRYAKGGTLIVQCKHYLRTGLKGLLTNLKVEAGKVRNLKPTQYILATSLPLSPADKVKIVAAIGADAIKAEEVFGSEDLNNRLRLYPKVEQAHYKLWLASRAVLDRVMNSDLVTQSEFQADKVQAEIKRWVHTSAYPKALEQLDRDRVVILSGPPGVGKTTLADMLLYRHLEGGYQPISMRRDIGEGLRMLQAGQKQIFHYDDFMGRTFLGETGLAAGRNEDRAILDFIQMIQASKSARLVLTTREHIFNQALEGSERLRQSDIADRRLMLTLNAYTPRQRARILYNHIYFSDLPLEYQDRLIDDQFYLIIIRHEKFSPRLVEWLATYRRIRAVPAKDYRTFVLGLLQNPAEIWRHAYTKEISEAARSLLLALYSLSGRSAADRLELAFDRLHAERAARYKFPSRPEDFRSAWRELANAFVKSGSRGVVEVLDPSVLDLMNTMLLDAPQNAVDVLRGARDFGQVERVFALAQSDLRARLTPTLQVELKNLAPHIQVLACEERRVPFEGGFAHLGPSYEARLKSILLIADRFQSSALLHVIDALVARLLVVWKDGEVDIIPAAEALQALSAATWAPLKAKVSITLPFLQAMAVEANRGCRSDELRELIEVIDFQDPNQADVVKAVVAAGQNYLARSFSTDLGECRAREASDSLNDDLEFFSRILGVTSAYEQGRVAEAKTEFEEHEDAYADHMQDQWKEDMYDRRAEERDIDDLFGSLRDDRD